MLLRFNLKLENCRGQCYDGARNMKGHISGVSTQLLMKEPRAIYTHCYGHFLNLVCQDTIRSIKVVTDAVDTTFELSKVLIYSSKHNATFKRMKSEVAPSEPRFRTLCPTQWTVRADSLASVVTNNSVIRSSLDTFSEMASLDMEMSAKVSGNAVQFSSFNSLFGVMLGENVLRLADNLSRTLQQYHAAELTRKRLTDLRTESEFVKFWTSVTAKQGEVDVDEPAFPRRRRAPKRLEVGTGENYLPSTIEDYYRVQYYEALDLLVGCIRDSFDKPGYEV